MYGQKIWCLCPWLLSMWRHKLCLLVFTCNGAFCKATIFNCKTSKYIYLCYVCDCLFKSVMNEGTNESLEPVFIFLVEDECSLLILIEYGFYYFSMVYGLKRELIPHYCFLKGSIPWSLYFFSLVNHWCCKFCLQWSQFYYLQLNVTLQNSCTFALESANEMIMFEHPWFTSLLIACF